MGHPNLSDDLNRKIDSATGVFIDLLKEGTELHVHTQNSIYYVTKVKGKDCLIRGNNAWFHKLERVTVTGSTWGGSCMKIGWVGVGMHMEVFRHRVDIPIQDKVVVTSEIVSIQIIQKEQNWLQLAAELTGLWR